MKKIVCFTLILCLLLAFTTGLFACKDKEPVTQDKDKNTLAVMLVNEVFKDEREDKDRIKDALLALLEDAELEDAEIVSILSGMIDNADSLAHPLLDLKNNEYSTEHVAAYRSALQTVANAVSPEMAGRVFYAAASKTEEELSYSMSDCEKIASLFLGDNDLFDLELDLVQNKSLDLNEKQLNTAMITFVSALRKAVGISEGARAFLRDLSARMIDEVFDTENETLDAETRDAMQQSKDFLLALAGVFLDNYDRILSFTADYLAQANARLFLGLPYEKKECTAYYGYDYATWHRTAITKEQYEAREGGYDEYIKIDDTLKGFTVNGTFVPIDDEDAALADKAYRLSAAYRAYALLDEAQKETFKETAHAVLSVLAEKQEAVAAMIDRKLSETPATNTVSIEELISALPALSDFDATDGVSEEERSTARQTALLFIDYLHGYFPKIVFTI